MKKFGISQDTAGSSEVAIPVPVKLKEVSPKFPNGYSFPVAKLVTVKFDPEKEVSNNGVPEKTPVLIFVFKDAKGRNFTHIEFPYTAESDEDKANWQQQRIKHIWDETIGASRFPKEGIGNEATNYSEYFDALAKGFNAVTVSKEEGKTIPFYSTVDIYIKLVYNNKNRVTFPLFPNFIQRAVVNGQPVPAEFLVINLQYDTIEQKTPSSSGNSYGGGRENTFGSAAVDNDFPDVM